MDWQAKYHMDNVRDQRRWAAQTRHSWEMDDLRERMVIAPMTSASAEDYRSNVLEYRDWSSGIRHSVEMRDIRAKWTRYLDEQKQIRANGLAAGQAARNAPYIDILVEERAQAVDRWSRPSSRDDSRSASKMSDAASPSKSRPASKADDRPNDPVRPVRRSRSMIDPP